MKSLFLIGGPMGVGKTAVSRELQKMLPDCVFLDGDWCWDAAPFRVTEETRAVVLDNICHMLNNFLHCTAYRHIVFCWVMHEQAIVEEILRRLDTEPCSVHAVSLVCTENALRERLEKDVRFGVREPDVIPRSLQRLPLYQTVRTVKIDTTDLTVQQVAAELAAMADEP